MSRLQRTPRSFTVERRNAGRRSTAPTIDLQPSWPIQLEGPAEQRSELNPPAAASALVGRVLPALDQPAPVVAAPKQKAGPDRYYRTPFKKAAGIRTVVQEAAEQRTRAEFAAELAPVGAKPDPVSPDSQDTRPEDAPPTRGRGMPRLPRSTFPFGERWKARLPAASFKPFGKKDR